MCVGLSLQWLLLLQSTGSSLLGLPMHMGLVVLWHVGSSLTRDQTCVPCIGRRIPITVPPESPCHIFFIHSFFDCHLSCFYGVSIAQTVKNLPTMRETWVQSLCWEAPLEEGMATHSSIRAWRIPRTEEPGGPQSMRLQRVEHD